MRGRLRYHWVNSAIGSYICDVPLVIIGEGESVIQLKYGAAIIGLLGGVT